MSVIEVLSADHQFATRPDRRATAVPLTLAWQLVPLAIGLGIWLASLAFVDTTQLGDYGLLPHLHLGWYVAVATLVLGAAAVIAAGQPNGWIMAGYVGAIVLALYATIPAVADAPQYPWVFKHIGVTQLIEAHGGLDPNADIYNRWPGLFALGATFARLAGSDPVSFVAWAEPVFMAVDALLVGAIALAVTSRVRVAGAAALLFVLFNWVGQTYYSPQAAASTLALALMLVVLRGMPARPVSRWRLQGESAFSGGLGWPVAAVVGVVLLLDLAVVVTHQLTPFAITVQVAALAILGTMRSWRLVAALALLPLLFVVVNFDYLSQHYTLLTSLDPLDNLRSAGTYDVARSPGKALNANLSLLLSAGLFAGALGAAYALRRRGSKLMPLTLLALAFSPFAVAMAQSYGGEASLRIILYAAPWAAILIAAALMGIGSTAMRTGLMVTVAGVICALMVPAFYGVSQLNVMPRSTVDVSEDFYARAPAGSVLMLAGPGFPLRVGARYDSFRGPVGDADPNLLRDKRFRSRPLGAHDLSAVIREIHRYSQRGFLAFSTTQQRWAETFGLTPPGALDDLRDAVARSPRFRIWGGSDSAQIFELLAPGQRADSRLARPPNRG